jgi:glycolate oxidase
MSSLESAITELQAVVGSEGVLCEHAELLVYECDGFPIAKGLPGAVVFPTTTQQVSDCVKILVKHGIPLIPRGSGTGLAGGAVAFGQGVLVTTSRMKQIQNIDVNSRFAVVQPGVPNMALSVAAQNASGGDLYYSPDPSSQRASSIGGNASTNAGGINTLKHGVTTNHILGMQFVLPDAEGTIITTRIGGVCDGIGPDLPGLLCGSEGTFAILTRIWCRLVPMPKNFRTVYAIYDSIYDASKTVTDVIASGILPTSMEMMDGPMIQVVEDAFDFGFPRTAAALLLMEIDGVEQTLDEQMDEIVAIAKTNRAGDVQKCSDPKRRAKLWAARKQAFGAIGRISRSYCTQDACIPRSKLPEAMDRIAKLGQVYGIKITNVFHAGDGNVHPIMLFDEDDPKQVQNTLRLSEAILEYCISIDGTITGEHGVGVEKLHLMRKMFNADTIDLFNGIKETFDPDRRLNDGKMVPSPKVDIQLLKNIAPNTPGGAQVL